MSGSIKTYTPNFKMIIPEFNVATWHDYIEENFRSIDALFYNLFGINGFSGIWKTNTTYKTNQVLFVGEDNGSEYEGRLVKVTQDTNTGGFATFSEAIKRYPNHYEMYADASSAEVYATLAQDWATKTGDTIKTPTGEDTGEYSAKHHAQIAGTHEEACEMYRNLAKTDSDLAKESENEATSQAQIAQTQATNAETSASNALNSANLAQEYANDANTSLNELKTTATDNFNTNADQKINSFNNNYESKLSSFNTNATTKTNDFNSNATKKTEQVNTIASSVSALVNGFDENVTTKTSDFNKNVANKTTAFNENATQLTNDYDSNASSKLSTFNSNVNTKTQAFNTNASEKQALVDAGASNAQLSATNAKTSETNAKTSENNAKSYSEQAESNATTATQMSNSASTYATTATTKAEIATTQAGIATTKAQEASNSASTATSKASIATTKAQEATTSATNASSSATSASNSASLAKSWAVGDNVSRPEGSAKYWAHQASIGQLQSDWSQTDNTKKDFIKNKPTKLSQFTNDSNFVNTTQLATKQDSLTTAQLSAVNSSITKSKVSTYDGYQTQINNRQLTANISQSLDTSTTKYPSNNAVKTAIDNIDALPSQSGNSGKFLTTDGMNASWKYAQSNKIGEIIQMVCTSDYVPDGCLPCNGSEYTKGQFSDLWNNYLVNGLLNTCTYTEYASDISTYGQCGKFAIDTTNNKFKVPTIKDGSYITQAMSDSELGKAYNESLPNITASWRSSQDYDQSGAAYRINSGQSGYGSNYYGSDTGFDASRFSSTYQDGAKVQGDNVRMRFFVVVANGQVNQSMMDWSSWASSLNGKANADLSNMNANNTAKETIVGWGMPDYSAGVSVTLTSGQTYTAQYNQVLCAIVAWGTTGYGEILARTDNDISSMSNIIFAGRGSNYDWGAYYLYLKKGQSIYIQSVNGVISSTVYPLIGG